MILKLTKNDVKAEQYQKEYDSVWVFWGRTGNTEEAFRALVVYAMRNNPIAMEWIDAVLELRRQGTTPQL